MTNQELQTLINVNKFDNNADRAAANVWEDINGYIDGHGGFFTVKTYLATLMTVLDRVFTEEQMTEVIFPLGNEIVRAFNWDHEDLFKHDIYGVLFEGVDGDTSICYDRTVELAGATHGDLEAAEVLVARNLSYALQGMLACWEEQLPELTQVAQDLVNMTEFAFS